jgi:hypothetical protein
VTAPTTNQASYEQIMITFAELSIRLQTDQLYDREFKSYIAAKKAAIRALANKEREERNESTSRY